MRAFRGTPRHRGTSTTGGAATGRSPTWRRRRFVGASLTMDGPPELVLGRGVTPNFFDVLGVRPVLGRSFTPADDRDRRERRGHQPRALAAALRRRSRHRRPHDPDERRQVRGDRRRAAVVRLHQSRDRLLGPHSAPAESGRYPPEPISSTSLPGSSQACPFRRPTPRCATSRSACRRSTRTRTATSVRSSCRCASRCSATPGSK